MSTVIGRKIVKAVDEDCGVLVELDFSLNAGFKIGDEFKLRSVQQAIRDVIGQPSSLARMLFGRTVTKDLVVLPGGGMALKIDTTILTGSDIVLVSLPDSMVLPYLLPDADYTGQTLSIRRIGLSKGAYAVAAAASVVHELTHVVMSHTAPYPINELPQSEYPSNLAELAFYAELGFRR